MVKHDESYVVVYLNCDVQTYFPDFPIYRVFDLPTLLIYL